VTEDGVDAENPAGTPDGWIVYYSRHEKKRGLWKIRADGTGATQLVSMAPGGPYVPEVSPDGRWVAYTAEGYGTSVTTVRVARFSDGKVLPFSIRIPTPRPTEPLMGRLHWMPNGRALAFVGQNEKGVNGVFVQDFDPEMPDTKATRRALGGFDPDVETESFAISPDGSRLVIAGLESRIGLFTRGPHGSGTGTSSLSGGACSATGNSRDSCWVRHEQSRPSSGGGPPEVLSPHARLLPHGRSRSPSLPTRPRYDEQP
jgi:Tol biopolymer transport system component